MTDPAVTAARASAFSLLLHDVRRVAGVDLAVGAGLGGKAMLLARPVRVQDYRRAGGITHDCDDAVHRERGRAFFAVPIR